MLMISVLTKDTELDKRGSWLLEEGETGEGVKPRRSSEHSWAGKNRRINGQRQLEGELSELSHAVAFPLREEN